MPPQHENVKNHHRQTERIMTWQPRVLEVSVALQLGRCPLGRYESANVPEGWVTDQKAVGVDPAHGGVLTNHKIAAADVPDYNSITVEALRRNRRILGSLHQEPKIRPGEMDLTARYSVKVVSLLTHDPLHAETDGQPIRRFGDKVGRYRRIAVERRCQPHKARNSRKAQSEAAPGALVKDLDACALIAVNPVDGTVGPGTQLWTEANLSMSVKNLHGRHLRWSSRHQIFQSPGKTARTLPTPSQIPAANPTGEYRKAGERSYL